MPKTLADDGGALSPGDFDEIEKAVMETARGRWFLAEYAKRLRHADSDAMIAAMAKLHAAITANQDEIVQRLASALDAALRPDEPRAAPPPPQQLHERQMRYFRDDEDLFEPAEVSPAQATPPRATVHRLEAVPNREPPAEVRDATPPHIPLPTAVSPSAAEPPRRRIVIIRHKPGETIDVPLQQELAESA